MAEIASRLSACDPPADVARRCTPGWSRGLAGRPATLHGLAAKLERAPRGGTWPAAGFEVDASRDLRAGQASTAAVATVCGGERGYRISSSAGTRAPRARGGGRPGCAGRRSFAKMLVTCFSTARSVTTSCSAIAAFERPSAISSSTSRSRGVSSADGIVAALPADELRDDRRVERGAALADAPHRRDELVDVGDAVLEQVADALGALGEELERVGGLEVLREHEHAGLRVLLADLRRRPQALVGLRRRHADVDDRDVRACTSAPSASARRRSRPGRRPRSPRPRAGGRSPRGAARSPRRRRRASRLA